MLNSFVRGGVQTKFQIYGNVHIIAIWLIHWFYAMSAFVEIFNTKVCLFAIVWFQVCVTPTYPKQVRCDIRSIFLAKYRWFDFRVFLLLYSFTA